MVENIGSSTFKQLILKPEHKNISIKITLTNKNN